MGQGLLHGARVNMLWALIFWPLFFRKVIRVVDYFLFLRFLCVFACYFLIFYFVGDFFFELLLHLRVTMCKIHEICECDIDIETAMVDGNKISIYPKIISFVFDDGSQNPMNYAHAGFLNQQ